MKIINKNSKKIASIILAGGMSLVMSSCAPKEMAPETKLDFLKTDVTDVGADTLAKGIEDVKDVNGEDFKLVINYMAGDSAWHINANKKLYFSIKTQGLSDKLDVYIDNIHMDTYIISSKAGFNGINQDSMDDRIHNSLMYGFPINDTKSCFCINSIDGENEQFIKGYSYGDQYYTSGSITQRRRLESDYLEDGVYANEIDAIIDLIIVDKASKEVLRQVSVDSSLGVYINNEVEFEEEGKYVTYKYNKDGSREAIKTISKEEKQKVK